MKSKFVDAEKVKAAKTERRAVRQTERQCYLAACIESYTNYNNADRTGRNWQAELCAMQQQTTTMLQDTHTHVCAHTH